MKGRQTLPPGWIRDPNNPGLIKLSGSQAGEGNALINQIRKMDKRILKLEKTVKELEDKLNKPTGV